MEGHFKWRCTGPDLAPGMMWGEEEEEGQGGNSQTKNTCKVKCTPSSGI